MIKIIVLAACLFISCSNLLAQGSDLMSSPVTLNVRDMPLHKVLSSIETQTPFRFAYNSELILQHQNITLNVKNLPLKELLNILFSNDLIRYSVTGNQIILQKIEIPRRITVSGYIKDARSGESLAGASLYLPDEKTGAVSNNYGFYSITVDPEDTMELKVSYIGYNPRLEKIPALNDVSVNIRLDQRTASMDSVIVAHNKQEDNINKNQAGTVDISQDMFANAPSIGGDGDILSSVQMLPGVQAGLDGTPGYYVRGGNAGQNLVQLDEATLYNPSHLFGLVSIFNAPAVKNASLMKGGFPASYGGHLSSVLEVYMKEGDNQQPGGIIQAGTIASGITLYGPLEPHKASFLIAARRSTIDLLLQPFPVQSYFNNYYFYDVNAKINYQFSQKDQVFLSLYKGLDNNAYSADSAESGAIDYGTKFGNQAVAFRWNHLYSGKLFSNTSLIYNNYFQLLTATQEDYFAQLYSGIRDINFKADLYYYPGPAHNVRGGVNYLYQTLFPATLSDKISPANPITGIKPGDIPEKNASRFAAYISDEIKLSPKFSAYAGVRMPLYYRPDTQYINAEPRLSLLYLIAPSTSIKVAYSRMHQYIHLVQSYNASFPAEIWIGSSKIVQPAGSDQVSAGIFKNFKENIFQTSLEFYYKSMDHQLLFKGGTQPTIDNNIEDSLVFGNARSYGAELLIRKSSGKFTGWLAYTFSYAWQQFDSLNSGQPFPFAYDRRHSIYISVAYAPGKHWKISANFFLASGRPFTLNTDTSAASSNQDSNPLYDEENNNGNPTGNPTEIQPNNYRLTPYNRLDISIRYKKIKPTPRRVLETEWIFSVYNVYASRNTSLAYRAVDPVTKRPVARQVSLIPVIPSITYSFKF